MFDKLVLGKDGDIPAVFRTGLLREDTASGMDELMNEIEKGVERPAKRGNDDGETSMDSKMEDTPANYN